MKPGRPATPPHRVKHGTNSGYFWHRKQGENPCEPCKRAHADNAKKYTARRKAQKKVLQSILTGGKGQHPGMSNAEVDEIIRTIKEELNL